MIDCIIREKATQPDHDHRAANLPEERGTRANTRERDCAVQLMPTTAPPSAGKMTSNPLGQFQI